VTLNASGSSVPSVTVDEVDAGAWIAVVADFADHNYEQSSDYAKAMAAKSGAVSRFLVARRGGEVIAAACVRIKALPLVRRGIAYISGGPLLNRRSGGDRAQRQAALRALRRKLVDEDGHVLYLRPPLSPGYPSGELEADMAEAGFRPTERVRSYRTVVVGLSRTEEELRKRLAGKWRTDLNFAGRAGFSVEQGAGDYAGRFMRLFGQMRESKDFDVNVDPEVTMSLPAETTGLVVLIASKDGRDAAGHVLSLLGDTAVYLFGATNEDGRAGKAGYLLNWQAMLLAKHRGLSWYDLGGIDPDANPGGYRFKARMGGEEVIAPGPFMAAPDGIVGGLLDGLVGLRRRPGRPQGRVNS
jgi:lipid II:glycine glycyltransferase (peptidoglycan interpeptide bridge formation enzyme)